MYITLNLNKITWSKISWLICNTNSKYEMSGKLVFSCVILKLLKNLLIYQVCLKYIKNMHSFDVIYLGQTWLRISESINVTN